MGVSPGCRVITGLNAHPANQSNSPLAQRYKRAHYLIFVEAKHRDQTPEDGVAPGSTLPDGGGPDTNSQIPGVRSTAGRISQRGKVNSGHADSLKPNRHRGDVF